MKTGQLARGRQAPGRAGNGHVSRVSEHADGGEPRASAWNVPRPEALPALGSEGVHVRTQSPARGATSESPGKRHREWRVLACAPTGETSVRPALPRRRSPERFARARKWVKIHTKQTPERRVTREKRARQKLQVNILRASGRERHRRGAGTPTPRAAARVSARRPGAGRRCRGNVVHRSSQRPLADFRTNLKRWEFGSLINNMCAQYRG